MKTKESLNFKNWVMQHNPELDWDWDNPKELKRQLIETCRDSGILDLKTIFELFFAEDDSGLTFEQNDKFLNS